MKFLRRGMGWQPHGNPHREAIQKSKNQGAKRNLIPIKLLKTAAKRRRGLGMKSPSGAWGGNPIVTPRSPNRKAIQKKQASGSEAKPDSANPRADIPIFICIGFSIPYPPFPRNVPTDSFLTYRKWRKIVRMSKDSVSGQTAAETKAAMPAFLQDCFSFHSKYATIRPSNLPI